MGGWVGDPSEVFDIASSPHQLSSACYLSGL